MKQHYCKKMTSEELEELFSNYLIDSWSFSKVASFARNEKAFEMSYIYGYRHKSNSSTVAGDAYHYALEGYFNSLKEGVIPDIVELQERAFENIDSVKANYWKLQKTTPTVEDCRIQATKTVNSLLEFFLKEVSVYDVQEILYVELYCDQWLTINGVDIPLPCHAKIDLVFINSEGKTIIADHKSKKSHSSEEELKLSIGRQAITYYNCLLEETGIKADEVWFIENKYSKNRDGGPQLNCFKVPIDENIVKLYEALLYEPLRRMIEAVNNPDYIYLINDNDNFVDRAEVYEFWAKTMIAEVEEFNIQESKKEIIAKRLKKIRDVEVATVNPSVIKEFRRNAAEFIQFDLSNKDMTKEQKIEHILRSFGFISRVAHKFDGYSSDTFLLEISAGVKMAAIYSHRLDLANVLDVPNIRISKDLIVYEGKSYLSIETPKKRTRDLLFDPALLQGSRIPLGRDNFDNLICWDVENHSTPHILTCGATGSGKSVFIDSIINYGFLYGFEEVFIFDPKYEFTKYEGGKAQVYNDILDIEVVLETLVERMQQLNKAGQKKKILIIFDEFADAMANSRKGRDLYIFEQQTVGQKTKSVQVGVKKTLEENLRILLQKGRSIGFRIVAATQRASVKVITGDAKVNFPVQVCFRVPKEIDSKVVLDEPGAEALAGYGDGLIKSPEFFDLVRFQSFYKP